MTKNKNDSEKGFFLIFRKINSLFWSGNDVK